MLEESRLGVRRQKSAADVEFEEACQAILGARLGVWWEDDRCYYKVGAVYPANKAIVPDKQRPCTLYTFTIRWVSHHLSLGIMGTCHVARTLGSMDLGCSGSLHMSSQSSRLPCIGCPAVREGGTKT